MILNQAKIRMSASFRRHTTHQELQHGTLPHSKPPGHAASAYVAAAGMVTRGVQCSAAGLSGSLASMHLPDGHVGRERASECAALPRPPASPQDRLPVALNRPVARSAKPAARPQPRATEAPRTLNLLRSR